MKNFGHFDFISIGSGPAGQKGALQAAKAGYKVAIIERRPSVGGVSLHSGTIPSKTMRSAIIYLTGTLQKHFYGKKFKARESVNLKDITFRIKHVLDEEVNVLNSQLERNNIQIINGQASFLDKNSLEISCKEKGIIGKVTADKIVIATGSLPRRPKSIPFDYKTILDGNLFFSSKNKLDHIPNSVTIMGAGVIGLEYACMFLQLGCDVTIINQREEFLTFVDNELLMLFKSYMEKLGAKFILGHNIQKVFVNDDSLGQVDLENHDSIINEIILYTMGRTPCTRSLNLDKIGIKINDRGNIVVNDDYQTNIKNIYAAGDIIGFPALASTSAEQGRIAACHALGLSWTDYRTSFPYGIYTIPAMSMCGKTEEELIAEKVPYAKGIALYCEIAKAAMRGGESGALKILFHKETRKILGVHVIGDQAAEIIHIGQAVMTLDGTIDYFVNTVFNYPTYAEAYKVAAFNGINSLTGNASIHSMSDNCDILKGC
ncbi:MAG: Si-specific NAD(P)(+) transhydrogenase [Candidatus Cloacimonadota bacterium]|nr:MAG: Si-specific NAD(P)(+) transhydrogenase [Candidatus Cloacimonadota bacterium]